MGCAKERWEDAHFPSCSLFLRLQVIPCSPTLPCLSAISHGQLDSCQHCRTAAGLFQTGGWAERGNAHTHTHAKRLKHTVQCKMTSTQCTRGSERARACPTLASLRVLVMRITQNEPHATECGPGQSVIRRAATTLQCFDVFVCLCVTVWLFPDKAELPVKGQKSIVEMIVCLLPQQLPWYRIIRCDSEVWQGLCDSLEL